MKRFTFMFVAWICMLCATGLPAAHAVNAGDKITQLSDLSNTAAYTIENTINGRGYMAYHPDYNATTGGLGLAGVTLSGYEDRHKQVNDKRVNIHFKIIKEGTKYYFYNIGAGKYLYVDENKTLKLTGTETNRTGFTAEERTSGEHNYLRFSLEVDGNTHYLTFSCDYYSANQLPVRIESGEQDAAQCLTITYIGKTVNVNFTYTFWGHDFTEGKLKEKTYTTVSNIPQVAGQAPYAPTQVFLDENDYRYSPEKVPARGGDISVSCTQVLPFALTTDLEAPEWYIFYFNPTGTKYMMKYNPDDSKLLSGTQGTLTQEDYTFASDDRFMWCIMGNLVDGFKLYNKKAGTNLTLNATASNPTVGTAVNNNDLWKLTQNENGQYACFQSMKLEGDNYIHAPSSDNFVYSSANDGSSFVCVPWYKYAVEKLQNLRFLDGAVGMADVPQDIIDNVTNSDFFIIEHAPWANEDCVAKVNKNIQDRLAVTDTVAFKPGYYYVYSAHQNDTNGSLFENGKGIYYDKVTETMRWGDIDKNDPDYIVKFTQDDEGKYYLLAPNAKKYMLGCEGATGEKTADSPITFVKLGERQGQYKLHFGDGNTYANEHGEGSGTGSNLINTDGGLNSASAWYLIPAETIDIAMNVVGNSSYASTYLPFAVKNITDNTFVSTISIKKDGNEVVALGVPQTVLSKECGAVIRNNNKAGTVTLQILDEEPAESTTSDLTGTLQGKTVEARSVLTFGRDKSNTANVGFYKYSGTTIKPNKAYLEMSALPSGNASIRLVWGDGTTTDIDSTTLLPANVDAPVFDLSGRRVNRLQRGHIYLQRGRKFIAQ